MTGNALLAETTAHRFEIKRVVLCARQVLAPQFQACDTQVGRYVCAEVGIEVLVNVVALRPVDSAQPYYVGTESKSVQHSGVQRNVIVCRYAHVVHRHHGNVFPLVVVFAVVIFHEFGVCKTV